MQILDDVTRFGFEDRVTLKFDITGNDPWRFRWRQSGNGMKAGGFPGTVRTDQGHDFAFIYMKTDPVQGLYIAVFHFQIFN